METNDLIRALLEEIARAIGEFLEEAWLFLWLLLARALGEPEPEGVS